MQMAPHRVFLTQDHRLALVWRLLSYLVLFIVVNLVANVARVVLQTAFDWVAIIVGLGSVVSADRHLLHLERTASLIAEDLLSTCIVALGILLFLGWAWWSKRHLGWRTTLAEDGQPQATQAQIDGEPETGPR